MPLLRMLFVIFSSVRVNISLYVLRPTPNHVLIFRQALKLAERTIQFSDTLTLLTDGYIRAGRVAYADGLYDVASSHFNNALEGQQKNVLAAVGRAQTQIYYSVFNPILRYNVNSLFER
jgi:hypothetical protein